MIRYFEVFGLDETDAEYFGFMDTVSDRIVELDGAQFFGSYADFKDYLGSSHLDQSQRERLAGLVPERMKRVTMRTTP